jgi:hypothetical protein
MIETGLYTLLSTEPLITSLVGTRVYPVMLPTDGAFPAITYQIVGGQSFPTLTTTGLQKLRIQFDCWATDAYLTAAELRAAVTTFLAGRSCQLANGTRAAFQLISPTDFFSNGDEAFRCSVELYCLFCWPG